ncbi:MAG TPA: MBL fold metallo-hydrolase [Chitinophagaceae bacterium]|nr:MBL fold metallo-hydrolase [Chitinophagaceae bacterium]
MIIEQIYTGCLAQGAYYIESEGEAVVIDPLREVEPYLEKARRNKAAIKYVFETHFHADFVSGHIDLANKTGASIVYGPGAKPAFPAIVAEDNRVLKVGKVEFVVLHTPGHTMESACFLLRDENGKDVALFTGDTLFIGDVGRPDLAQKAANMTKEELASILFDSLRNKIIPLANDIVIYPAHGAGSACGKNMSNETTDTLGHQKATNYALRADMTKEEFIKEVTTGLVVPPAYFPLNAMLNKQGYESIDEVLQRGHHALTPELFETAANETGALILDTRDPDVFVKGFIPNSINIGIRGNFAPWAGALIVDIKQPILIVAYNGEENEVITRLSRVGFDHVIGFLEGGFPAWQKAGKPADQVKSIYAPDLADIMQEHSCDILDVRKASEYDSEHVVGAENLPLDFINDNTQGLDRQKTYYVHCASGYRSVIFISILQSRGFRNLVNVQGGFKAIKESLRFPVSDYMCPATML